MDREKLPEQKAFELDLANASDLIRDEYRTLLLKAQLKGAKSNKGASVTISLEEREKLLDRARQIAQFGHADPEKMADDWERASANGRPPLGGAQDD
ncbi:MAG: hypothetical protein HYV90_00385 [Candidatus Woesebacteria bacterium]|nr:MAG: hypothetical protein HYV90_00385 [Candidatus Woesebacteria bacterium]